MKKTLVQVGLLCLTSLASAAGLTVSVSDTTGAKEVLQKCRSILRAHQKSEVWTSF